MNNKINKYTGKHKVSDTPKVSVVMPVFNGEAFLKEAIDSILKQSFENFEMIIINDGSTDNTAGIIQSYNDKRIIIIQNKKNLGITKSLNIGIGQAKGDYIARMDADEISHFDRFDKQVSFLEKNLDVCVCGTLTKTIGKETETIWLYALDHESIKANLLFHCCLVHSSVMIRSNCIKKYNIIYSESYPYAEDYELWVRLSKITKIANLDEILIRYRIHNNSIGVKHNAIQVNSANQIRENQISKLLDLVTKEEINFHNKISHNNLIVDNSILKKTCKWFRKLYYENKEKKIYREDVFKKVLAKRLNKSIRRTKTCSLSTARYIFASPFAPYINITLKQKVSMFWKIVMYGVKNTNIFKDNNEKN